VVADRELAIGDEASNGRCDRIPRATVSPVGKDRRVRASPRQCVDYARHARGTEPVVEGERDLVARQPADDHSRCSRTRGHDAERLQLGRPAVTRDRGGNACDEALVNRAVLRRAVGSDNRYRHRRCNHACYERQRGTAPASRAPRQVATMRQLGL